MTEKEFRDYMEIVFDNLEKAAGYYWQYKIELKIFEFINRLAYSNDLIPLSTFVRTNEYIKKELSRYGEN